MLRFTQILYVSAFLFVGMCTTEVSAVTIAGTVWCAGTDADCGGDQPPGPERLSGLRVAICDENGNVLVRANGEELVQETDASGSYSFSGLFEFMPRTVFYVKLLDVPDGKFLGSINCLNTHNVPGSCEEIPGELNPAPCGDKNIGELSIVIDVASAFPDDVCESIVNGVDFVLCEEDEPEQLCWMTGGGVKFDRMSGIWMAGVRQGRGPRDSVGGVVYPSCSPFPSNGGQWNHVAHGLRLHLIGADIRVIRCGNVEGIEPGTESPVCSVNFIEFEGVGRLQGIGGNRMDPITVTFFGRVEDRNEPGNEQSVTSGEDVDRYFLRVVDGAGDVRILVDEDGDPATVDPLSITGGNFQIHCTSCDDAGGGGAAFGDGGTDLPHEIGKLFLRGDSNFDGQLDVADPIHTISYLFHTGSSPVCLDAADTNDDGALDLSDPIQSLRLLFIVDSENAGSFLEPTFDETHDQSICAFEAL
jgi:hypothetical protein